MINAAELLAAHEALAADGPRAPMSQRKALTIGLPGPDLAPAVSYARAPEASGTQPIVGRPPAIQRNAR